MDKALNKIKKEAHKNMLISGMITERFNTGQNKTTLDTNTQRSVLPRYFQ